MVWCIGTTADGQTFEFGYPLSSPLDDIRMDAKRHFTTIEILYVDYNL